MRTLGVLYGLGVAALGFGMAVQSHYPWAIEATAVAKAAPPAIGAAAGATARAANQYVIQPAWTFAVKTASGSWHQVADWIAAKPSAPPKLAAAKPAVPVVRPANNPPVVTAQKALTQAPQMTLAEQPETENAPLMPAPDATPPSPGEIARVLAHLKISLTKELYDNFGLFLYVSKADHGPWHQRMFVFDKEASGDLKLVYSFPVSTGREQPMASPDGSAMWNINTPTGYFQLDPDRVYRRYTSQQWGHKMPYAMFFSWEHEGRQTGIAIHSAVDDDVKALGARASAGCVRLAPQNAELLFRLIKANYRGLTPLFAYDRRTATMSKEGLLMHDKEGKISYAEGYRVLVLIENSGGDDIVAALF